MPGFRLVWVRAGTCTKNGAYPRHCAWIGVLRHLTWRTAGAEGRTGHVQHWNKPRQHDTPLSSDTNTIDEAVDKAGEYCHSKVQKLSVKTAADTSIVFHCVPDDFKLTDKDGGGAATKRRPLRRSDAATADACLGLALASARIRALGGSNETAIVACTSPAT